MDTLITYGLKLEKDKFKPILNKEYSNKPHGGLWASTCLKKNFLKITSDWKEWCLREKFKLDSLKIASTFRLKRDARILELDSLADIIQAMWLFSTFETPGRRRGISYTKVAYSYDAIHVSKNAQETCDNFIVEGIESGYCMPRFDAESWLILNPDAIDKRSIRVRRYKK